MRKLRTSQAERAKSSGVSRRSQQKLDRLARDFPDLHEQVKQGKLSPHRAGILAGFRKEPSALDLLKKAWEKATEAERAAFLMLWSCDYWERGGLPERSRCRVGVWGREPLHRQHIPSLAHLSSLPLGSRTTARIAVHHMSDSGGPASRRGDGL
jgi:hypothetical protein